ncbi:MAG: rod shape-determining protein RodA [Planctomycetota bacterium]|nr:MAG: rod shape-determining protein RodA [Planctomycetota bacterium]REK40683.1 MAG: rod shape-determining protein RodA [Planctomycetota bacterium]
MKSSQWATRLHWSLPLLVMALIGIGCLAIARSDQLAAGGGHLVWRQLVWAAIAVTAMFVATWPSYRVLCPASYLLLAVVLVLLVAVYFFPAINGSHRWIRVGPIGIQPSELAKVACVMALARWLMHQNHYRTLSGLLLPLGITLLPVLLILREPDLGTALVFLPVLFAMLFAAGARRRDLATIALIGFLAVPLVWLQMTREQKSRVTAVLSPATASARPDADGYHLYRSKQTLAAGGWWGSWLQGESEAEAHLYLVPAAATDSILCIVAERYGLWGVGIVLLLQALLVNRCLCIARDTQEPFGRLLAVGVAALIAVQVIVNSAMLVGLLPITGLSLPLLSYGGSGLLAHCLALGLVLNVGLRPGYEVAGEAFRFVAPRRAA